MNFRELIFGSVFALGLILGVAAAHVAGGSNAVQLVSGVITGLTLAYGGERIWFAPPRGEECGEDSELVRP